MESSVNMGVALKPRCKANFTELVEKLKTEFTSTRKYIDSVERKISSSGVTEGLGTGGPDKKTKLSAKDCPVSKMAEKMDVLEFRQWLMTVERQLESACGMVGIDAGMEKLRFTREKMDKELFHRIIAECDGDSSCPITSGPEWDFDETTRFFYNYLIGKLNKEMFEHVQNVAHHNGW